MLHTGFFIAIAILPALWLVPLAVLFPLMYYETSRSGPRLSVHLALNAAFLAWSVYAVLVLHEGLHSTNSPLIVVPRLLVPATFYAFAIPRLVSDASEQNTDLKFKMPLSKDDAAKDTSPNKIASALRASSSCCSSAGTVACCAASAARCWIRSALAE